MARSFPFAGARLFTAGITLLGCAAALALAAAPARATGTVTITQANGAVETYPGTAIKIIHNALFITTSDGSGTLVVNRAACSYQGEVMTCLPTGVTLVQAGSSKPLDLASGTIYANMTGQPQPLSLSSMQLPPHSILLSFKTKRGTYVNLSGSIDKVSK